MAIVPFIPDSTITETWLWSTDTLVSTDGTEQRIQLLDTPARAIQAQTTLMQTADVRSMQMLMMGFGGAFDVPHYQHQTKLTAVANAGDSALQFDASLTELRDGCSALVFDRITEAFEEVVIAIVSANGATLDQPLANKWGETASICPVWSSYASDNSTLDRDRVNNIATISFTSNCLDFLDPFLNEFNTFELPTFNGLPVIEKKPNGDDFSESYNTGATVVDYGTGVKQIYNPWQHAHITKSYDFLCHRTSDRDGWKFWRAFGDYCRGSLNPFYVPTGREDFDIVGTIAGANAVLAGTAYLDVFFPWAPFKALAINTSAGVFYTSVTAAVADGANTALTLDPPLPAGAGYAIDQTVSMLLQMRISDDQMQIKHVGRDATVTLNLRTVDA